MADTVFEAEGKISLDSSEMESGLSKVVSGVSNAAKVIGTALSAAATGVASLVKSSVSAYADYEQLVGGVETLFGAGGQSLEEYIESVGATSAEEVAEATEAFNSLMTAQNMVLDNAANAYATVGMSANDYMTTVTSFSAALVSSLGGDTVAAAEAADQALTDMADNANKMGTDMESIQNAYQGFAKQNYTMLDNLKLGYGGTEEEMERLLEDAEAISGVEYDISNLNDVYSAIHVIQTEMGITGTTAKEASTTISGSLASLKAAWENLLVGFSDADAEMSTLIDNVVETAKTFLGNVTPVISQALAGIGQAVEELAPIIGEELPGLLESLLPGLISGAESLVSSAVLAIAEAIPSIVSLVPTIVSSMLDVINSVISVLSQNVDTILPAIFDAVIQIVSSLTEVLPEIIVGIIQLLSLIAEWLATDGVQMLISVLPGLIESMVSALLKNLPLIIECGTQICVALIEGIIKNLPEIIEAVIQILIEVAAAIIENLPIILEAIGEAEVEIAMALMDALGSIESDLEGWGAELEVTAESWLQSIWSTIWGWFSDKMPKTAAALEDIYSQISSFADSVSSRVSSMFETVNGFISHFTSAANSAGTSFASSVSEAFNIFAQQYQNIVVPISDSVMSWLTNMFDNIISGTISGLWNVLSTCTSWFAQMISAVVNFGNQIIQTIQNILTSIVTVGKNFIEGLWKGISEKFQWIKSKITELGTSIINLFKTIFGIHSPSKVFRDEIGKNLALGIGVGFTTNIEDVKDQMTNALDFGEMTQDIAMNASGTMGTGTYSTAASGESGSSGSVYALLAQYLPGLSKLKVVMDTGELVGVLADPMDLALGKMAALGV